MEKKYIMVNWLSWLNEVVEFCEHGHENLCCYIIIRFYPVFLVSCSHTLMLYDLKVDVC